MFYFSIRDLVEFVAGLSINLHPIDASSFKLIKSVQIYTHTCTRVIIACSCSAWRGTGGKNTRRGPAGAVGPAICALAQWRSSPSTAPPSAFLLVNKRFLLLSFHCFVSLFVQASPRSLGFAWDWFVIPSRFVVIFTLFLLVGSADVFVISAGAIPTLS